MRLPIVVCGMVLIAATSFARAQGPSPFVPLGTPGGFSRARAISPDGGTVYGFASDGTATDGFRWTRAAGVTPLGLGNLGAYGSVWGASADGRSIVGNRHAAGTSSAAIVITDGVISPLPALSGYTTPQTEAFGVSADGTVIAGQQTGTMPNGSGRLQAVRWSVGVVTPVADVGAEHLDHSIAYGISRDGTVIVGGLRPTGSTDRAFRWTEASGTQVLGLPRGFTSAAATGVSADNRTVIGAVLRDSGNDGTADEYEAVRFVGGNVELLGDLPGGPLFSVAHAVSADGSVVVGRSAVGGTAPRGDDRAFVWDAEHGMRDLAGVLTDLGADLNGWRLTAARAVSDDGRTIAGDAVDPGGREVAFVAVVPEPGVGAMTVATMILAGFRRDRRRPRD
jgi:uncharacterized membrane protein